MGGDLAELAARLGRAPGDAASVEAERTVPVPTGALAARAS